MTMKTYEPNTLMNLFDTDPLWRQMVGWDPSWSDRAERTLRVNVIEKPDQFILSAEVPGFKEDQIQVEINNGRLTLKGTVPETTEVTEQEQEAKEKEGVYRIREFAPRNFERTFKLGEGIDQEKVSAKLEHGILNVVLPKKEEVKPKAVKVEISS